MGNRTTAAPNRVNQTKKIKKTKKRGGLLKGILVVLLLLIALLAAAYLYLCARVDQDRILGSVTVGDTQLQGMTLEEARAAVQTYFSTEYQGKPLDILLEGETYTVIPWDESRNLLSLDVEDQLQKAMEPGHGDFLTRGRDWLEAQRREGGQSVTIAPTLRDREGLTQAIAATGIGDVDTAVESSYSVGEESISITKGSAGVTADMGKLTDLAAERINSGAWPGQSQLDCATLESSVSDLDLQQIYDEIYVSAQDATLDKENNYAIVDSVTGVSFDLDAAQSALDAAEPGSQLTIDLIYTEPEITTQKMKENLFKDKLGSYSTNVSGSSGRKSNVKLSAQYCDGTILLPGETFSYNDVVGQRTKARGFSEAPAYLNGETIQEVGGGICQTSSTIYAACLYSNLEITARTNHTYASSYIGLGLDATVSWGGPEFKFTNDTKYPIRLDCTYSGGQVTAAIYGTKMDDITVKITSETLETIPAETGEGSHHTGYKVQTYRKLYDGNGSLISSTPEAYSYYRAS